MLVAVRLLLGAFGGVILTAGLRWVLGHFGIPLNGLDGKPISWTVVIVAGIVIGVIDAAVKMLVEYRRWQRNRDTAAFHEWQFIDQVDAGASEFRRTLSLFRRNTLRLTQRMTGTYSERAIDLFDASYSETTGSGKNKNTRTYVQTVYRFPQVGKTLCPFRVVPRSRMFRWLEGLLTSTETELHPPEGATEADAAAFETFRQQYQLSMDSIGVDPSLAPRVFHPFVVAWLSLHPGWVIEADQQDLLAWQTDRIDSGDQRVARLDELCELLRLFEAGERATKALGTVQIERKPHDPASTLNKMFIISFGVGLGLMAGFFTTVILVLAISPLIPKGPWEVPAWIAMCIVPEMLGMISGFRFGYLHATGVPLAQPWEKWTSRKGAIEEQGNANPDV